MKTRIILLTAIMALLFAASGLAQTRYEATIAEGESVSTAVTLPAGCRAVAIAMPAALNPAAGWTAANLTFQVSVAASAGTEIWANRKDDYNIELAVQVGAASDVIDLPFANWFWVRRVRVRSGTATAPVAQEAARTLAFICEKQ